MKICSLLLNDINFEPTTIQPCCNTHGIDVPKFEFYGGEIDKEGYENYINNVIYDLQKDNSTVCKGCSKLIDITYKQFKDINLNTTFKTVSLNMDRHLCM